MRGYKRKRKTMTIVIEIDAASKLSFAFFDSGERKGVFLLKTTDAVAIATGVAHNIRDKMLESR
jgi:hypothetical protein